MKTIAKYEKDCEPQRYCILYHTSNTWSVEAMKTIAKYEKDCEPQRYCILYHTSNAHCALSPHDGNAYSLISIDTLALTPEFSSESTLCCIACVEKTHSQFPVASAGHS